MTGKIRCASAQVARWCLLGMGAAILAFALKPHAATFTYTNPACTSFTVAGTPPTQTVTCITAGGGGVPTCAPIVSPAASVAVNTQVTITANCDSQPTSYQWTGGACATNGAAATCTVSKSRTATVLYSVSASNGSGAGSAAQVSVTWK